jgi:hypothetical protein
MDGLLFYSPFVPRNSEFRRKYLHPEWHPVEIWIIMFNRKKERFLRINDMTFLINSHYNIVKENIKNLIFLAN